MGLDAAWIGGQRLQHAVGDRLRGDRVAGFRDCETNRLEVLVLGFADLIRRLGIRQQFLRSSAELEIAATAFAADAPNRLRTSL